MRKWIAKVCCVLVMMSVMMGPARTARAEERLPQHVTPKVQKAVQKGLDWLAKNQGQDGNYPNSQDGNAYPVSMTGLVAGGANVLVFTTGRGSVFGCKPTPSIKLATNHDIYRRMLDDMDINCGDILDGVSIEAKGQEIFDAILRVASGEKSKSELLGYGDNEFVPWQIGATM